MANMENYEILGIISLQIMYIHNSSFSEYKLTSFNKVIDKLDKELINKKRAKRVFNILPLYFHDQAYGVALPTEVNVGDRWCSS